MTQTPLDLDDLLRGIRSNDRAALGRAITLVESDSPGDRDRAQELLTALLPSTGGAHRIGVSGVPGVGKSTFIERFGLQLVDEGHRVAVLAVDPSSSVSKGSILGDKTRMEKLAASDGAFIRPSPTGGSLGGVARKTREAILVCEAAGYDVVLVETVGVGQSETAVAEMVDFFLLLKLAGAGDELQGIKRGILELADLIAINKADGENLQAAELARAEFERALQIVRPEDKDGWTPKVVTSSGQSGAGLDQIWEIITEHHELLSANGELEKRRKHQLLGWMWSLVDEGLRSAVREHPGVADSLTTLEKDVLEGRTTPTSAAEQILSTFKM
ncbi:MAG: methylmalonyl Co-A mutase-associated GTPase MeaB [Acidobacteriota bacterium]|nr:methylmalonyl Co-A mutase-associated GTPase MeaB [Acidobacteriota bacterium]